MLTTGLAFSGGKDSWACLWLNKDRLDKIQVIWVDTGKNYPEVEETVKKAAALCPNFVRIVVDRAGQNEHKGIPADIVPIAYTKEGHETSGKKDVLIQSYLNCCHENIALRLIQYCKKVGITELINGQRNSEKHKSTSTNGSWIFGIKRIQPIEDWDEYKVLSFVSKHMELPEHFKFIHSSMDCYDCTAYRQETKDIAEYRKINFPELDKKYSERKTLIDKAIQEASM
jgi:3'-phosphoadenosine 5'-phosphosulfate sulfotransferase (PAPS reductase)/FAD synthetase